MTVFTEIWNYCNRRSDENKRNEIISVFGDEVFFKVEDGIPHIIVVFDVVGAENV